MPVLITKTVSALTTPTEAGTKANPKVLMDDCMVGITGRLANLVVRSLDAMKQGKVLQDAFDLFVFNKPSSIILKNREQVAETFKPFGPRRGEQHVPCMTIFTCIIAGIRKEVCLFQFRVISLSARVLMLTIACRSSCQWRTFSLSLPKSLFQSPQSRFLTKLSNSASLLQSSTSGYPQQI